MWATRRELPAMLKGLTGVIFENFCPLGETEMETWQIFSVELMFPEVRLHDDIMAAYGWGDHLLSMWADRIWVWWDTAEWLVCKGSMNGIVGTFFSLQNTTDCCHNYCSMRRTVRWLINWPFLLVPCFLWWPSNHDKSSAQSTRAGSNLGEC